MELMLAIKFASLIGFLWFGSILMANVIHKRSSSIFNTAFPWFCLAAFIWSMGWLA